MKWRFEKFQGNMAIYAICPECGFMHNPSSCDRKTFKPSITTQYKYCPMCGNYLYDESDELDVIWNERNMQELCDQ